MRRELVALTIVLMLVGITMAAQAGPESAASSGWAITTNHHGEEVPIPPFPPLKAKVLVSDENFADFYRVVVDLRDPLDEVVASVDHLKEDLLWTDDFAPNGKPIKWAWTDDLVPDTWTVGHYSVKAYFYAADGRNLANDEDLEAMRATTQMVVPEAPTGTLAVLLAMFAGVALFAKKRS